MGGKGSGSKPVEFDPASGVDPWERQPGETGKAFAAFAEYRKMGPERAIRKVVQAVGQKDRYASVLEKWSARWGWVTRAAEWDSYEDRREREAVLEVAEKKAVERVRVAQLMVDVSAKSLFMWNEVLNHAMTVGKKAKEDALNAGAVVPSPPSPPISPNDTQRLADAGMKLVQLLEGKPTDIREQRQQITVEERRKGIQQLVGNPKLRAAMKQVAEAMEEANTADPDGGGNGDAGVVH